MTTFRNLTRIWSQYDSLLNYSEPWWSFLVSFPLYFMSSSWTHVKEWEFSLSGITCFQTWKQRNVKEQHLAKLHYYELYNTPINISRTLSSTFGDLSLGALPWSELHKVFCKALAQSHSGVHAQKTGKSSRLSPRPDQFYSINALKESFREKFSLNMDQRQ